MTSPVFLGSAPKVGPSGRDREGSALVEALVQGSGMDPS